MWVNEKSKIKEVTRMNLVVENENLGEYNLRREEADERRKQKLYTDSLNGMILFRFCLLDDAKHSLN